MYLEYCDDLLEQLFPESWELSCIGPDKSDDDAILELTKILMEASTGFFKYLNLSLISGEYIFSETFNEKLDALEEKLNLIAEIDEVVLADKEYGAKFSHILYNGFVKRLNHSLKHYRGHQKKIERKYKEPSKQSLFEAISRKNFDIDPGVLSYIGRQLNDFELALRLSDIDHNLIVKPNKLQDLLLIYHTLEDKRKKNDLVVQLLLDKCSFLLKKVIMRFTRDPHNYYYALDFEDKLIEQEGFSAGAFQQFENSTKIHYPTKDKKKLFHQFEAFSKECLNKWREEDGLSFEEYHALVKYQKEYNHTSLEKFEVLVESFKRKRALCSNNHFDKWAFGASKVYIHDNLVSFKLKKQNYSIDDIDKIFIENKEIQGEENIKNYFPFLKISEILLQMAENELKKNSNSYDEVNKIVGLLEEVEKEMFLCFEWCSDHQFIPYQLPFGECRKEVEVDGNKVDIFLASSFILPMNFEKVSNDLEEVRRKINDFKSKFDIHISITKEKQDIKEVKETIQRTDKRHIEILSVFSAIVLFVSSNIQVFSKAETFADALRFMLIFSYVLIVFVLVVWFITREKGFKLKEMPAMHKFVSILLFIATTFSLLIVFADMDMSHLRQNLKDIYSWF